MLRIFVGMVVITVWKEAGGFVRLDNSQNSLSEEADDKLADKAVESDILNEAGLHAEDEQDLVLLQESVTSVYQTKSFNENSSNRTNSSTSTSMNAEEQIETKQSPKVVVNISRVVENEYPRLLISIRPQSRDVHDITVSTPLCESSRQRGVPQGGRGQARVFARSISEDDRQFLREQVQSILEQVAWLRAWGQMHESAHQPLDDMQAELRDMLNTLNQPQLGYK